MKEETRLPDNALRELKPGEEYEPIMKFLLGRSLGVFLWL